MTLKTMTVVALSFLLAVPSGNVVLAEEEAEVPETVVEETAEEVSESETAEPEEETVVEETEEPSEEVVAEEPAEPAEEAVEETEEPAEEVVSEETTEPAEEVAEETAEPEEEAVEEETAKPEEAASEEEKPSDFAETEIVKTPDAEINGTIADTATPLQLNVETNANITVGGETKYYSFTPAESGFYMFRAVNSEYLDSRGYVYDSSENQIAYNDDDGGNGAFSIIVNLEASTLYYFGVNFYSSGNTGSIPFKLTKIETAEGWNQVGNNSWVYVKNGEIVKNKVIKIGNSYYGFNYNGLMYANTSFSMDVYDANGNYIGYFGYRAKDTGALYVNQWYEEQVYNASSNWYYYGADARAVSGIAKVNGKDYLFNNYGKLLVHGSYVIDGVTYIGDDNGYPVKADLNKADGWLKVGSAWFYIKNKSLVTYSILALSGKKYGFDNYGKMYSDESFSMSEYDAAGSYIGYFYYRASASGVLLTNAWYQDQQSENWYYYDENSRRVSGVKVINGKTYVFADYGWMYKNTTYSDGSKSYVIDGNGIATLLKEGWNKVNNVYYYVSGGNRYTYTVAKIGDAYYGFDNDGKMFDNCVFNLNGYYYRAKSGGALYVNSWVGNYYYGADGKGYVGDRTVNGVRYFFTSQGEAVSNRYVLAGDKLYYTNAKCAASEVTKDGLYREILDTSNGQVKSAGVCVSGGKIVKNDWKKIDGKWYYFGANGFYYTGTANIDGNVYYFNTDGTMCGTGWQKTLNGSDIYVYAGGALATGKKTIDGKKYCFTDYGYMVTGLYNTGDGYELYGRNGQLIGPVKTGWNEISGTWYYFNGSEVYQNGVYEINGEKYGFSYDYSMYTDYAEYDYVFGSNGKAVKSGWAQIGAFWYYVDSATGRMVTNRIMQIGGKKYLFGQDGTMLVNSFVYNGIAYTTDGSGAITSEKSLRNGWELAGGTYYYYKDGTPYNGWVGNYYISGGVMLRNQIADGYWVGNDGVYSSKAGWLDNLEYGYGWMYAKSGGKLVKQGWEKIDGSWYYFSYYEAITRPLVEDAKAYYFDVDGKLVKTVSDLAKDQWVNAGDYWGYIKNGQPVYSGKYMIDGKEYSFAGGRMQRDSLSYYYDYLGRLVTYVQSDGTTAHYNGWKMIHGRWYFFDLASNAIINGWINDNGKKYYIDYDGMATGWVVVNGILCNFGSNGALVEEVTQQNGWLAKGGNWYYFVNGRAISGNVKSINGKVYGFSYDGKLGNNELIGGYGVYYADANGIIVKNTWKKVDDVWYYFGADGLAVSGIQRINGTVYYFNGYILED